MEILNDARDRRTDGRMDRRMDGRTDERTNERYGEIRSGTVGGPSRLASIHSPPNSLDLGISFSSRTLSLRLVVPVLLCHVFHLPRASNIHLTSPVAVLSTSPARLFVTLSLLLLFPYHSSCRLLFAASSSRPFLLIILSL